MPGKVVESAANNWEVDRQSCGQVFRPYYVVVVRNKKKAGKSVVKASSSDSEAVSLYVEQLHKDLDELTNYEFETKYELKSAA